VISDDILKEGGVLIWAWFLVFVLAAALMVTNMLIGVLCEVVSLVAAKERERMDREMVEENLQKVMDILDEDKDQQVTKGEFLNMLKNAHTSPKRREAVELLQNEVGVDVIGIVDFIDFIFDNTDSLGDLDSRQLTFTEFVELMMQLRGENKATVKDVVDMRKFMRAQVRGILDVSKKTTEDVLQEVEETGRMEEKFDTILSQYGIIDRAPCGDGTSSTGITHQDSTDLMKSPSNGALNCHTNGSSAEAAPQAVPLTSADKSRLQSRVSKLLQHVQEMEKVAGELRADTAELGREALARPG